MQKKIGQTTYTAKFALLVTYKFLTIFSKSLMIFYYLYNMYDEIFFGTDLELFSQIIT